MIAIVTALLLQAADPSASAAATETPAPATSDVTVSAAPSNTTSAPTNAPKPRTHCRWESDIGSNISHRVCRTEEQATADRNAARGAIQERVDEGIGHDHVVGGGG